jgi:hypothetical protein
VGLTQDFDNFAIVADGAAAPVDRRPGAAVDTVIAVKGIVRST